MGEITRRTALKAAPAVALTAAVPGMATDGDSEIMRLFREWDASMEAFFAWPADDDEGSAPLFDATMDAIDAIVAAPCRDLRDVAAKMVALAAWDDVVCLDSEQGRMILAEMAAIMKQAGFRNHAPRHTT